MGGTGGGSEVHFSNAIGWCTAIRREYLSCAEREMVCPREDSGGHPWNAAGWGL